MSRKVEECKPLDDGTDPVEYEFRYYHPVTGAQIPLVARARDNEVGRCSLTQSNPR